MHMDHQTPSTISCGSKFNYDGTSCNCCGIDATRTKDLKTIRIDIGSNEEFLNVSDSLEKLCAIDDILRSYPFFYAPNFSAIEDGWTAFQPEEEFSMLIHSSDSDWRMSYVNKDFSVCRTYPRAVVVPVSITDDQIRTASNFRQGGRFPVLSYRHTNGEVIFRTSQPLVGPNLRRSREDERFLAAILQHQLNKSRSGVNIRRSNKGYIVDTRTPATSQSEKAKGGGFESENNYPGWRRITKSIDRYHFFLDSYSKLMEACSDLNSSSDKWMTRLTISSWLTHVKEILNCGCLVAQCLDKEGASVVVHGSEGLDVTLCVTSLAQIILNPDCRTVRGFEALIEREWVQAGHPFWSRTSKGPFNDSVASKSKSHAPTFTIFLDCVWQIYNQFPCSFEFTERFLVFLADSAYFSNFGTFVCDCDFERALIRMNENTSSLWSYLNRPEILSDYLNCMYEPNRTIIWPSVAPISLGLWTSMYLRWLVNPDPVWNAKKRAEEIVERNKGARLNVLRLRRQLKDLADEAEKMGLLQSEETTRISHEEDTATSPDEISCEITTNDNSFANSKHKISEEFGKKATQELAS